MEGICLESVLSYFAFSKQGRQNLHNYFPSVQNSLKVSVKEQIQKDKETTRKTISGN